MHKKITKDFYKEHSLGMPEECNIKLKEPEKSLSICPLVLGRQIDSQKHYNKTSSDPWVVAKL